MSYRRVEKVIGRSYETVRQWYHNPAHLFDPEPDHHSAITIDETKLNLEETDVYVWAALDVETFEVIHTEVSPGRSDLDALLFVERVLKRCRGDPVSWIAVRGTIGRLVTSICVGHTEGREGNGLWSNVVRPVEIPNQALL